jgi:putative peptidoglycan lipid II flippase
VTRETEEVRRTRGSVTVGGGILLSRITGLIRERIFAHFFGASPFADAWRAALRMPNVLQNLLGEGTLSASFIPIYAGMEEEDRPEAARRFAGAVFGLLTATAGALALLGVLLAPVLVAVFFAGFDTDRQAVTVGLVRILFPMTAVLVLSAWCLGILNSHRRFFLSYAAPVLWNAAMIGALAVGGWGMGMEGEPLVRLLAWGALVGGALQFLVQLPLALRLLGGLRPTFSTSVEGVREAIRNFTPVLAARGVVNLSGWLDYALAAFLATGAVAALGYAQTLYILPISLFGMSVAASELPELSRRREGGGVQVLGQEVSRGMERIAFFLVPSTLAYLILGDVVVAALYQTGAFGAPEVLLTWGVLAAYALGMGASGTSRLLSSAFYALRDTRTPARIAYLRVALSLGVGAALMLPLDRIEVGEGLRLGAAGLALGASLGAWVELALLRRALQRSLGTHGPRGRVLARLAGAGVGAVLVGLGVRVLLPDLHPIVEAAGVLGAFGVAYLVLTRVMGVGGSVSALLPARFRPQRTSPDGPEPETTDGKEPGEEPGTEGP